VSQVMDQFVEQRQRLVISHRVNTIGRPRGHSVVWTYRTDQERLVKRPDDGSLAKPWRVRCGDCRKDLEFRVHSVVATRRRRLRRRGWAWVGWTALVGSAIGYLVVGAGARPFLVAAGLIGAYVGYLAGLLARAEVGVTGHGVSMPIVAAHRVQLIETRSADYPELVCPRCGHREDYRWQSIYRTGYRDAQYQAAAARLQAHRCPEGPPASR